MTKNKLLELYEKLKQNNIKTFCMNNLMEYTDEEIDIILNSPYLDLVVYLIQIYKLKLLTKDEKIQLIKIMNNAPTRQLAEHVYYLATIDELIISGKIIEISSIITKSYGIVQAEISYYAIQNISVLTTSNCSEIIKLLCQTKNEKIASIASIIATDENVLVNEHCLELIQLVSECDEPYKADLAAAIAKNEILLKTNKAINYIKRIKQSKDIKEARNIFSEARTEIAEIKLQEQNCFMNIYDKNPEEAIALLKSVNGNEEIKPYTKIRKRKKDNE